MVKALKGTFFNKLGGCMQDSFNMVFQGWKQHSRPKKTKTYIRVLSGIFLQ